MLRSVVEQLLEACIPSLDEFVPWLFTRWQISLAVRRRADRPRRLLRIRDGDIAGTRHFVSVASTGGRGRAGRGRRDGENALVVGRRIRSVSSRNPELCFPPKNAAALALLLVLGDPSP